MKTFEQHRARLELLYGRPFSPDEAAELLQDLESYVTAHKRELTAAAKPAQGLSRAAWALQGPQARHRARLRVAIHNRLEVPLSDADEVLQALQAVSVAVSVQDVQAHAQLQANRLDVARALAGNPQNDQPFMRASATSALSVIRRLSRTEARRIVDEIDRRAHLVFNRPSMEWRTLNEALNVTDPHALECLKVALWERAGVLAWTVQQYAPEFAFPRLLEDVSIDDARQVLVNGIALVSIGLRRGHQDILRRVAQRDSDTEATYDDIRPEDAWRELADLTEPDLADRFNEMDSAEAPVAAWWHGTDPASRQLARAVSDLPASAHLRGLQRAAGLARFASTDIVGRLGLSAVNGREELHAAIDGLSQADAQAFLHNLAAGAHLTSAWKTIWREAFLEGVSLAGDAISDHEIYLGLARRAGVPESDVGQPAYYQALRELPAQVAQDLLHLADMRIFEAPDVQTIQAVHDAAQSFPTLEDLALNTLRGRPAWEGLARDVRRAELTELDDRAAHEEVLLQVILASTSLREGLARAAGLDHLFYSHALRERAERAQRDVPPDVAAWRELTAQLGLSEYRLAHADSNARRTVAVASLRQPQTVDELVRTAGLSTLRDHALREQRAAFFQRKKMEGPQRQHDGHSL